MYLEKNSKCEKIKSLMSNNIFDSRDNVTFSSLLSIFILFPVFKCRRERGKQDREEVREGACVAILFENWTSKQESEMPAEIWPD